MPRREYGDDGPIPNPLQQTYDTRALREANRQPRRDYGDDGPIPNPLQQTFDKRQVQARGDGFVIDQRQQGRRSGPQGGGNGRQPDPMQTAVGYIGANAFHGKPARGRGRGGQGGGGGGGGGMAGWRGRGRSGPTLESRAYSNSFPLFERRISMAIERTLSIIKPDAVAKNVIGQIYARFEGAGLKIVASRMAHLSRGEAEAFYAVHKARPFFNDLVSFMISGPVMIQVLQGEGAITKNRELMGATDPKKADKGTIRADFADSIDANAVHGSDAPETAAVEVAFFFPGMNVYNR